MNNPMMHPSAQAFTQIAHSFGDCSHSQTVSQQPGSAKGCGSPVGASPMNIPQSLPLSVPPGLEYLLSIDQLLVKQKMELLEVLTGFETKNKYTIKNSMGQDVYYALEESDCCNRFCCGPLRSFGMRILDNLGNHIIHLDRPLACGSCCCPCCLQKMEISAPPGTVIGYVEQEWSILTPKFAIKNAAGDTVLRIKGPICQFGLCRDVNFNVLSEDGSTRVGRITKQWSGLARELFTDADYFGITFPIDLDVRIKAVLLGALFLIDMMYFETSGDGGLAGLI